ncbi:hypothetical protein CHU98_g10725 [Xylaria longipes]|nr:hypothetical protein CHU98_g10725 [Xylaria longipes]
MKENGGVLKVRDLLPYWFPDDEYFPDLIDSLQSGKVGEDSDSTPSPIVMGGPPRNIDRRTWERACKAYTPDDILKAIKRKSLSGLT